MNIDRLLLSAVVAALGCAGSLNSHGALGFRTEGRDTTCWIAGDRDECYAHAEEAYREPVSDRVTRRGDTLQLQSASGSVHLVDNLLEGEQHIRYLFREYLASLRYYLIEAMLYEGAGFVLVHEPSGTETWIDAAPLVSPDAERLVTASMDLWANYDPNRVTIWRLTAQGPRREWVLDLDEADAVWGPSDPRWLNSTTVALTKNMPARQMGEVVQSQVQVQYRDGQWRLVEP